MVGAEETGGSSPALTVAIAAAGPEQPLLATLASLAQDAEAPCEILVIDDGLSEPARLTAACADPRISIRHNERPVGAVASLNRAVAEAATPLIMLLHPGDIVLRGALGAMSAAMQESSGIGLAHAYWFPLDPIGGLSRPALRRHRRRLAARLPPALDHRRALVIQGNIVHALPTFRRAVLAAAGGLEGASLDDAVYRASLRVLARAEARLVRRVLCVRLSPSGYGQEGAGLRAHLRHLALCARVVREGGAEYLRTPRHRFARLASVGVLRHLAAVLPGTGLEGVRSAAGRLYHAVRSALPFPAAQGSGPYAGLVAFLGRWSFHSLRPPRRRPRAADGERIAYLLWRYPVLSETFVRREVQALRSAGLSLDVVTLESPDATIVDDPESPAGPVTYLGPRDFARWRAAARAYLRRRPWTVVRLWLFVVRHRYREDKRWWHDRDVLYMAARLADILAERGTTHVHSPWANHSALLAFLASRLLGITYSVQARASEIHRTALAPLAADRVRFAEFLVTNSHYNERYLRSLLDPGSDLPIHIINDGIEPFRFHPPADRPAREPVRLLSVGRLVESKGFRYLLEACRLLCDRGVDVVCDVIGGPQDPDETVTWIELRRRHAELHLESVVRFAGAMPFSSVLTAYRGADIVVLPCVRARDGSHDVTPSTLIEAMAMRLPVVSTTIGGIPELVDHGTDGLLVPPNHADALAAALERLAGDPALRRRLGEAGRRKVEARFDMDLIVRQRASLFWLQP